MLLPDVNVLVYAYNRDAPEHAAYAECLVGLATSPAAFAMSESVLAGFVRVVTHRRILPAPAPVDDVFAFCADLLARPNCVVIRPGPRHWALFEELCTTTRATGKLVAGARDAALAIEHGCEWVSPDADFARFPMLRWRHPLRPS